MRHVAIHMMDYEDTDATNLLSPDIHPVEHLRSMLRHLKSDLPSTMHMPLSLDGTLHFCWYLHTHLLIVEG